MTEQRWQDEGVLDAVGSTRGRAAVLEPPPRGPAHTEAETQPFGPLIEHGRETVVAFPGTAAPGEETLTLLRSVLEGFLEDAPGHGYRDLVIACDERAPFLGLVSGLTRRASLEIEELTARFTTEPRRVDLAVVFEQAVMGTYGEETEPKEMGPDDSDDRLRRLLGDGGGRADSGGNGEKLEPGLSDEDAERLADMLSRLRLPQEPDAKREVPAGGIPDAEGDLPEGLSQVEAEVHQVDAELRRATGPRVLLSLPRPNEVLVVASDDERGEQFYDSVVQLGLAPRGEVAYLPVSTPATPGTDIVIALRMFALLERGAPA